MNLFEPPSLIYSLTDFQRTLAQLKELVSRDQINLIFPVKSFPSQLVVDEASKFVTGFEVSNSEECVMAETALQSLSSSSFFIFFNSPYLLGQKASFSDQTFPVLDSIEKLPVFRNLNSSASFFIRIDPYSIISLEGVPLSRFGVKASQFNDPEFLRMIDSDNFKGFTFHTSKLDDHYFFVLKVVKELIKRFPAIQKENLGINIGGGIKENHGQALTSFFRALRSTVGPSVSLYLEAGFATTVDSGRAVAQILSWTKTESQIDLVLNLSKLCHLRWSQPILSKGPFSNSNHGRYRVNYWGPTCSESDMIYSHLTNEIASFDNLRFSKMSTCEFRAISGYSQTWNSEFNGIPKAKVIID